LAQVVLTQDAVLVVRNMRHHAVQQIIVLHSTKT